MMLKPRRPLLRIAFIGAIAAGLAGCGSDRPPTQPTPPLQDTLTISCPGSVSAQSSDGNQVTVTYNAPTITNGQAPVNTTCTPSSGSAFPVGSTRVSCSAQDARAQSAACTFDIVVQGPARLRYSNFMTFGDSLTAGVVSTAPLVLSLDLPGSYPSILRNLLRQRYPTQSFTITNAGNPGELAADEGLRRFRPELLSHRPEVVLLMEGTNDLLNRQSGANAALAALEVMITEAESQNIRVCLATIPPQRGGSIPDRTVVAGLIPGFNDQIRAIASRRQLPLIDVYAGMKDDLSLIGRDNLHPTALGYDVMARIFDEGLARAFGPGAGSAGYDARSGSGLAESRTMRANGAKR